METPVITTLVTAVSAVIVAGLTYYLTKRREQEIEWRKLKLEHYRTYMAALSGAIGSRTSAESQIRYADAVNTLQLVAPEKVLAALYNFQDEIKYSNSSKTTESHDDYLTKLLIEMRADIHPSLKHDKGLKFRMFDIPPITA
ncbi:hypothetical protein J7E24_11885 [Hymenobacter sp. ISL-91]|uniref:hypothetical protein n=1 Tax=Hymenobacter sp. ISL-91 TaxID=2819151 RepID=UPI001BE88460|nr:hypothetical protein [Hymenobacter sp. ISL-91]MBT2558488.1 hypothetical protein [Hymenobacter sp. ISL-91]